MPKNKLDPLLCLVAIAAIVTALVADRYTAQVLTWIAANALLAVAFRFVMLIGEFNMATAAFYGIGAYASAIATSYWKLPFGLSMLAAAVLAALVSLIFGYVTLRVKGPYFMLISFAFAEVTRLVLSRSEWLGGNSGIVGIFPPRALDAYFPAIAVGIVSVLIGVLVLVERSVLGRVFKAILNNDAIPRSVGIDVLHVKVICVAAAAAAAGLGGGLFAHVNNVVSPGDFTYLVSVFALAYVKLGGESEPAGAVIGATLLTVLGQYMLKFAQLEHMFYGGAIVLAMLLMPDGLLGILQRLGLIRDPVAVPAPTAPRTAHE